MVFTADMIELLVQGLGLTILMTAVSSLLALIIGIAVGMLRLSGHPIFNRFAGVYIELFRNIPALVLMIFLAFAVPNLFPPTARQAIFFDNTLAMWGKRLTGLSLPYYAFAAITALSINTSAYLAEIFRAGVGTIPQEIVDSARSLGATQQIAFRQILLPQGIRAAFPAISTRLIHNMKNTALAAFVAVPELFQSTQIAITKSFRALEFLVIAAGIYLILAFLLAALLQVLERRLNLVRF